MSSTEPLALEARQDKTIINVTFVEIGTEESGLGISQEY